MLFNTLQFAVFFIIVYSLYLALSHKWQNRMLLIASYVFYGAWDYKFLLLIFISTMLDYICGMKIYENSDIKRRKLFLFFSIFGNLSILGFFKYFNFFASGLQDLSNSVGFSIHPRFLHIILPVGISFYTFQTMSYTIDIYRKQMMPTRKFLDFALFIAYFPQLVAGPIERATRLLPQIIHRRIITADGFTEGCRLILWGLFKKVAVADRLAFYIDAVYGHSSHHTSLTLIMATFFFAFQIYCDFSGYSDIARGTAKVMGFDIMVNFRNPYFARNVREFWNRWHISLSTWLRDYLYIPLGGNRYGIGKTYRNVMVTMLLGGLWHGANWTFIVWGGLHGIYIIMTRIYDDFVKRSAKVIVGENRLKAVIKIGITFFFVLFTWIFFRAANINQAVQILTQIIAFKPGLFLSESRSLIVYCVIGILFVLFMEYRGRHNPKGDVLYFNAPPIVQWSVAYVILFGIILFGSEQGKQFIYFQF